MSTEQSRALAATIPTTEVVKDAVTFPRDRLGEPLDISPERFEAWLRRVRRDAAREALDGLVEKYGSPVDRTRIADYRDTHYPEETDR